MVKSFSFVFLMVIAMLLGYSCGEQFSTNHENNNKNSRKLALPSEFVQEYVIPELTPDGNNDVSLDENFRPYEMITGCADNPCDVTEFCGIDDACHTMSCDQIYQYGITNFTRYNPDTSEQLKCIRFDSPDDENGDRSFFYDGEDYACPENGNLPLIVSYDCGPNVFSNSCEPVVDGTVTTTPTVRVNRKCVAKTTEQNYFSCYDIAPGTDLNEYFADYIAAVNDITMNNENNASMTCTNVETNEAESPVHLYGGLVSFSAHTSSDSFVELGFGNGLPFGQADEVTFNQMLAASIVQVSSQRFLSLDPTFPDRCIVDNGCEYRDFCGSDERCHLRNCDGYYDHGPSSWTGNKTDEAGALVCEFDGSFSDDPTAACDEADYPFFVRAQCPANGYSTTCDDENYVPEFSPVKHCITFNRKCTAQPNSKQTFTCYDIAVSTNLTTYTQPYVDSLASNPNMCDDGGNKHDVVHVVTSELVWDDGCETTQFQVFEKFDPQLALQNVINIRIEGEFLGTSAASTLRPSSHRGHHYFWIPFFGSFLYYYCISIIV